MLDETPSPIRSGELQLADALRFLAIDQVEAAKSGHPGMPMGMADVATVLFGRFLKFDAAHPTWADRDRFVLSGGHGSALLYAILHLTGHAGMPLSALKRFRQLGSVAAGHPEIEPEVGIETTTGPLGQGFATAVGLALAERMLAARFGSALVDHRTWVTCGDGDLMEGISHEAASLAGHLRLSRLTVLWDDNRITIDGGVDVASSDDVPARFRAYGWTVVAADGHDPASIAAAIEGALASDRPTLVACRTTIGYGAPGKAGTSAVHGAPLGAETAAATRAALGWPHGPFEVPQPVRDAWAAIGARGATDRAAWEARVAALPEAERLAFERALSGDLPGLDRVIGEIKREAMTARPKLATRTASGRVLDRLAAEYAELVGGSADLTPSNNTRFKGAVDVVPGDYAGRYVHWGVREAGMTAAMTGLAIHGGIVPYGGTFLCFADFARPGLRLAALMKQRVIFVGTHDSIGLGEDGPTHQPVEHLAALRAMPNLLVLRPCDLVETAECWQIALESRTAPSVLALSRQEMPTLRDDGAEAVLSARGAYVLRAASGPARVTLVASGSEVAIAAEARDVLEAAGIATTLVSMPCAELFLARPKAERQRVLGEGTLRVGVEAAVGFGWGDILGDDGVFVGMPGFGASGPAGELYRHFGITAEAIVASVKARL